VIRDPTKAEGRKGKEILWKGPASNSLTLSTLISAIGAKIGADFGLPASFNRLAIVLPLITILASQSELLFS